mmetsp:Transcript_28175/g.52903  ORF Transcript_28175/g.52903 Transcript_28175/m.52903 type:complete len:117 (+) Transcript_28175:1336-1686(+)
MPSTSFLSFWIVFFTTDDTEEEADSGELDEEEMVGVDAVDVDVVGYAFGHKAATEKDNNMTAFRLAFGMTYEANLDFDVVSLEREGKIHFVDLEGKESVAFAFLRKIGSRRTKEVE